MNIYLLMQEQNGRYSPYDAYIVIAENEQEARKIHLYYVFQEEWWTREDRHPIWATHLDHFKVLLVGTAAPGQEKDLVLAPR